MKTLTILFISTAALFLGACSDATNASATDGGSATGGSAAGAAGGRSGTGGAGGGAAVACDIAYKCQQAIMPPGNDPRKLCAGTVAEMKFAALDACLCTGACASKCGDSVCAMQAPSTACFTCLMDATAGCGKEAADCSAN
ncbi:MAG: hypothetical protein H7X95_04135 [Deltaproteobacteria bacterium]|nr:hypothetical protein [Deltaproteobacteria bacterium]